MMKTYQSTVSPKKQVCFSSNEKMSTQPFHFGYYQAHGQTELRRSHMALKEQASVAVCVHDHYFASPWPHCLVKQRLDCRSLEVSVGKVSTWPTMEHPQGRSGAALSPLEAGSATYFSPEAHSVGMLVARALAPGAPAASCSGCH